MWPPTGFVGGSSQEGYILNVLHGTCITETQYKITFALFTNFSLASGQRPVGAPKGRDIQ